MGKRMERGSVAFGKNRYNEISTPGIRLEDLSNTQRPGVQTTVQVLVNVTCAARVDWCCVVQVCVRPMGLDGMSGNRGW